jgi:hypothetical protein
MSRLTRHDASVYGKEEGGTAASPPFLPFNLWKRPSFRAQREIFYYSYEKAPKSKKACPNPAQPFLQPVRVAMLVEKRMFPRDRNVSLGT